MIWKIILLAVCGVFAGVLGGMGMGGGALLIPALTVFFGVDQIGAQAVNLVAFIPMAILSLIIHLKNKRVQTKGLLWIILPALFCSLAGSFFALSISGSLLKRLFGAFLVLLALFQLFSKKIESFFTNKKVKKHTEKI
ncbi:MAG: sulfite exporter TauE/SafE family protein [Clostridia bacterium]|nr:sulfite exporter TauE/SafE family protein [Clostridia bacterium]